MNRVIFMFLPLFIGCEVAGTGTGGDCTDHSQCGEMQACVDLTCIEVQCLASSDCALHNYCNKEENRFECVAGCESDEDCVAGEACSEDYGTCEEYACRTTELDCPVGHTCNTATGDCVATQGLCQETCDVYDRPNCGNGSTCNVADSTNACDADRDCEQGYGCDMFLVEHTACEEDRDCTVDGAICYGAIPGWLDGQCVMSYCHKDYCMPNCNTGNPDCPAGFSCEQGSEGGVCWGACEWYVEQGYL